MAFTNISIKTLNMLEKSMDKCKKDILEDIYNKYLKDKVPKEQFISEFLYRAKTRNVIIKRKPKELDELDRCEAKVWYHNNKCYGQCKFKKLDTSSYCKKHVEKRNYGDWK